MPHTQTLVTQHSISWFTSWHPQVILKMARFYIRIPNRLFSKAYLLKTCDIYINWLSNVLILPLRSWSRTLVKVVCECLRGVFYHTMSLGTRITTTFIRFRSHSEYMWGFQILRSLSFILSLHPITISRWTGLLFTNDQQFLQSAWLTCST